MTGKAKILWGALAGAVSIGLVGWWYSRRSSIGGYEDVEDIEPLALHSSSSSYPTASMAEETPRPKRKRAAKRVCEPVEIAQESTSNTQILACRGEPLGQVKTAFDAFALVKGQAQLLQEEMVVLAMNSHNDVVATAMVHRGVANEVRVGVADVFRVPVIHGATRMILVHNHPSGNPTPSPSDVAMTKKFLSLGDEMGIQLLDHVIVGVNDFASLRDLGMMG
jgi:DNA repair protein RadC